MTVVVGCCGCCVAVLRLDYVLIHRKYHGLNSSYFCSTIAVFSTGEQGIASGVGYIFI